MAGYIRQSTFVDGDTITAALFNNEYNQLVNAFSNTSGHKHDGTTAEGPVIGLIGDAGETSPNNKVLIDTTNNHIEFYIEVSSNPVQQIYIADGAIVPVTDNDIDLGTSLLEFKNIYIDGTATIDTLTVDEAATVGTTLGVTGATTLSSTLGVTGATTLSSTLAVTGATTLSSTLAVTGTSTLTGNVTATNDLSVGGNLTVTGNATISGNLTFGDADTDSINLSAEIDSNIVPNTDDTYDLGTSTKQWRNLYIDGTAEIDTLAINGTTVTSTAAELNILDGVTSTAAELNILDGVTSTTAELNILDGVTATAAEINLLDGVTSTTAELNILDGVTATAAEINTLDGITSTVAELNILDGVTSNATELNLLDGITEIDTDISTVAATDTTLASAKAIKTYVDSQVTAQDLDFQGDTGGALSIDLDSESLTIAGGTGIDTSGATNTLTVAIDSTVATLTGSQTLTNKTLTTPIISSISNTGTLTLPTSTDTLVGRATTDTLTNKTLTSPVINTGVSGTAFLDDDTFATATASTLASSESIKAYVDTTVAATNEVVEDSTPQLGGNLDLNSNDITGTGNIDITGTVTTDGLNSSDNITITKNSSSAPATLTLDCSDTTLITDQVFGVINFEHSDSSDAGVAAKIQSVSDFNSGVARLEFFTGSPTSLTKAMQIKNTGDISFYDDTGTSQALFWDASAESLGIGTTSPDALLHLSGADTAVIRLENSDSSLTANQIIGGLEFEKTDGSGAGAGVVGGLRMYSEGAVGESTYLTLSTSSSSTNNAERVRINSSGNVGIGTTSPDGKVHIESSSSGATAGAGGDELILESSATTGLSILSGTANDGNILFGDSGNSAIGYVQYKHADNALNFGVSGGTKATIDSSGKLLVGSTTNLGTALLNVAGGIDVADSDYPYLKLKLAANESVVEAAGQYQNMTVGGTGASAYLRFKTANTERMRIDSSGNVGIGTTSPQDKLHVSLDSATTNAEVEVMRVEATSSGTPAVGFGPFIDFRGDRQTGSPDSYGRIGFESDGMTPTTVDGAFIIQPAEDGSYTERFRVSSDGNVGIGTSSPASLLSLQGDAEVLRLDGTPNTTRTIFFRNTTSSNPAQIHSDGSLKLRAEDSGTHMEFHTADIERMRIDSSGNVGIGTTSPAKLGLTGSSAGKVLNLAGDDCQVRLANSILHHDNSGNTIFHIRNHYGATSASAQTKIESGFTTFHTGTSFDERMRIESGGDVGIGVSNPSARLHIYDGANATEATAQLKIEGSGYVGHHWLDGTAYYIGQNSAGRALRIYSSAETAGVALAAGATSFGTYSDERLKENIQDIGSVTEKIKDIRCVSFNRTDIENSKETIGFIAQDFVGKFDQVLDKTKLRDGDEEEYYSIKYTETIPVLLKAIQEQQEQIEALQSEINELKNS